jgi:mRNA interferase YafQ
MRTIEWSGQSRKDYKREIKGKSAAEVYRLDIDLRSILEILAVDGALDPKRKDHPLTGNWKGYRDCHIRPDLLLLYQKPDADTLFLVRLGSHSEIFG